MASRWLKVFKEAKRCRAEPLIDGEAYFSAAVAAMESAQTKKDYIYILGWMLDVEFELTAGKTLLSVLAKVPKEVEIRILIWENIEPGTSRINDRAVEELAAIHNPNLAMFLDRHTFTTEKSKKLVQDVAPKMLSVVKWLQSAITGQSDLKKNLERLRILLVPFTFNPSVSSHHEKVLIVKSGGVLTAFCGGMDFHKNRVFMEINGKDHRFPHYHDTACRLQGPAAWQVLQKFKLRWKNNPGSKAVPLRGENEPQPPECPVPAPYALVVGTYNSPDGKGTPDRSLKKAYLKIIENARSYIYIEDQYLVNIEVAQALNRKIREDGFKMVTIAIQATSETQDILVPHRKRSAFFAALFDNIGPARIGKVCVAEIDKGGFGKSRYHPGLHAKTLIADDEIALVGSANVNRRSFTYDSETSVIVFDESAAKNKFASTLRRKILADFLRVKKDAPGKGDPDLFAAQWMLPQVINAGIIVVKDPDDKSGIHKTPNKNAFILNSAILHTQDKTVAIYKSDMNDLDDKIMVALSNISVAGGYSLTFHSGSVTLTVGGQKILDKFVVNDASIQGIFDTLFDAIIDPKAD